MAARTQLSFASFNLYNLNLPGKPIYRDTDGWSQEEYDRKIVWAAALLKTMPSRVWGFQELWHEDALEAVFEEAGLRDDYDLLTPPDHDGQRIVCAAAVEKGLLDSQPTWMVNFPEKLILQSTGDDPQTQKMHIDIDRFSRPALRFTIQPRREGRAISVYVAHLKSKSPSDVWREGWYRADSDFYKRHREHLGYTISTIRRSAEASALRMLIIEELKGTDRPLVVIGDLNDGQLSNTLNILTGQPRYLVTGLAREAPIPDSTPSPPWKNTEACAMSTTPTSTKISRNRWTIFWYRRSSTTPPENESGPTRAWKSPTTT
jgi:hypothetical protein